MHRHAGDCLLVYLALRAHTERCIQSDMYQAARNHPHRQWPACRRRQTHRRK